LIHANPVDASQNTVKGTIMLTKQRDVTDSARNFSADTFDAGFATYVPQQDRSAAAAANALAVSVRRATIDSWIVTLPGHIRPLALATKLERITLNIIARWSEPSVAVAYLDHVLGEQVGSRAWMAGDIVGELRSLRAFLRSPQAREWLRRPMDARDQQLTHH
jgi:hypothetical protein